MRSFWLAAKIAAVFLVVMGVFVILTLHLFSDIVMHAAPQERWDAHHRFVATVVQLGLVTMAVTIALSVWVTAPLRRMSRSMDRIASGDLEHRVKVRGRDEAAAMGRSFNAMADRVRGMIVGQRELMAGVSHELRSPLARMKLQLQLLREGKAGAERHDDLEGEIDGLDALVEELLLASRMDLQAQPLRIEMLELEDVCDEAWRRVADDARSRTMTLEVRAGERDRRFAGDRALVVRLLGNLFENAVRHAGRGAVTVDATQDAGRLRVDVTDEGAGVDDSDVARLFEPFFRTDRSRSRRTGAGGLGLMIVRRAVEAHEGQVTARNVASRGLQVSFDLPLRTQEEQSD